MGVLDYLNNARPNINIINATLGLVLLETVILSYCIKFW